MNRINGYKKLIVPILALVLIATVFGATALARELRVTTAPDLRNCVSGANLASGPDAGLAANSGDSCVVMPGTYNLGTNNPANITVENLILRSTDGASATVIAGDVTFLSGARGGLINVVERGVTVGGPASDQGFTITNSGGVGVLVTDPTVTGTAGSPASEDITIQNNVVQDCTAEGILFYYGGGATSIDTIDISGNIIRDNEGDGVAFAYDGTGTTGVSAIGRRGFDRNVVISSNKILRNASTSGGNAGGAGTLANVHFYNDTTIEQLAIVDNEITYAGVQSPGTSVAADGILFDAAVANQNINEIRDSLIGGNLIQYNSQNGIKFDYAGRLGENVLIQDNRGAGPNQGITHNGPADLSGGAEGNGIYVTSAITEVRQVSIINNAINSNRGWDGTDVWPTWSTNNLEYTTPCNYGNGLAIEASGRVENLTLQDNDFRLNLNDGVCIANEGDYSRSQVIGNLFRANGTGDYVNSVTPAPYGNGMGVYHDQNITGNDTLDGHRIEDITFKNNVFRENGGSVIGTNPSGLGFGLFLRTEVAEISRISFEGDKFQRNYLGGARLDTDNGGSESVRSGDIREIDVTDVTASESHGNPNLGSFNGNLQDNGDGIALVTDSGDISRVTVDPTITDNNGGFGLRIESDGYAEWATASTDRPGDVDNILVMDSTFTYNGTRAAIGRGSGLFVFGYSVRNIDVGYDPASGEAAPVVSSHNNDHGVQVTGSRTVGYVTVKNVTAEGNDRNSDTIGDGVQVNANEDLSEVLIEDSVANGAFGGFRVGVVGRQIAQSVTVQNNVAKNNRNEGIAFFAGRDLIKADILNNELRENGRGISIEVRRMANDVSVEGNQVYGKAGQGVGIYLDSNNVNVINNKVRRNAIGVKVIRATDNHVNQNNIARNDRFGMDATALQPGEEIDATNNWWGEPSGPYHPTKNAYGIGNPVTDKVDFKPYLKEAAVPTDVNFVITSLDVPSSANVGESVTMSATVENQGTEGGTKTITLEVVGTGTVKEVTKTINPAAVETISFTYAFANAGTYTVKCTTPHDTKTATIQVGAVEVEWPPVWAESGLQPSPVTSDTATLHIEGAFDSVTLMIFDLSGAKVLEKAYTTNDASVDLADLDNGVFLYLLIAKKDADTAKSEVKKLLVQK